MSQENVEIVRAVYEAVERGDFAGANCLLHPEIEFHTYARSPEAGVYHGRAAVTRYNEVLFEQFERIRFAIEELVDVGERVVITTTQFAVPKGGETEMSVQICEVWTVREGLLAERHSYSTREEAREAAGLSA